MEIEKTKINIGVLISMTAFFFTLSGGLWHLGFWSTFRFNYFEHSNLTDLFKSSIYLFFDRIWFIFVMIFMSIGFSVFSMGVMSLTVHNSKMNSEQIERQAVLKRRVDRVTRIVIDILVLACSFPIFFWMFIRPSNSNKYDVMPIVISFVIVVILFRSKYIQKVIPNADARFIAIIMLAVYPIFNFFIGKKTGMEILTGKRASIVMFIKTDDKLMNSYLIGKPYLGSSSEYHFFYCGVNGVKVIKKEVVDYFDLSKEGNFSNYLEGRLSYDELMEKRFQDTITIDTNKIYFEPSLNLHIDSSFRKTFKRKALDHLRKK